MVEARGGRRVAIAFFVMAFLVLFLGRWIRPVDDVASTIAAPFAAVIDGAASDVSDTFSAVFNAGRLRDENRKLQKENGILVKRLVILQAETHDLSLFKRMLRFEDSNSHMDLLPGTVIGDDVLGLNGYIIIDKGRRDGLRANMPVLDQNGYFVGTINQLDNNNAKVLLMVSASSSVAAVDLWTRARGLVEGRFAGTPQMNDVLTGDHLRLNDLVVTSGQLNGFNLYPRNILLGQIVRVYHQNDQVFQTADIRPAADFSHLEMVQVIRNWNPSIPVQWKNGP